MEKGTFEQKFKGGEFVHSLSHSFIPPGSQPVSANISLGLFCGFGRMWGGRLAHSGSWAGVSQQWSKNTSPSPWRKHQKLGTNHCNRPVPKV